MEMLIRRVFKSDQNGIEIYFKLDNLGQSFFVQIRPKWD